MPSRSYSRYLRASFLIIVLLVGVDLAADLWRSYRTHQEIETIAQAYETRIKLVHELNTLIRERIYTLNALLVEADPFAVETLYPTFLQLGEAFIQTRRRLEEASTAGDGEEQLLVSELRNLRVNSVPVIARAVEVARGDVPLAERREVLAQILPYQREMLARSEAVLQYYLDDVAKHSDKAIAAEQSWLWRTGMLGLLIMMLIIFIGQNAIRRITSREQLLTAEIDERRKLEGELEAQVAQRTMALQSRTEQLYEAQRVAHMGCWEWDLTKGEQRWTDELYEILDLDKAVVPSSPEAFMLRVHPDDGKRVKQAIEKVRLQGEEFDLDFRLLCGDNSERVIQFRMVVEKRDEEGSPTFLLGTLQDITERKNVEDQMRLAASVFAHTGDGVMITDANNRIVEINGAFSRILGYKMDDVVGRDPSLLKSERHQPSFYQSMWQSLRDSGQWQGEIWDKRCTGEIIPLWMTINAVFDERGWVRHYVALFRDITEVKRNEQTLWHIAHHDALTGLPNRNLMYDRLQVAMSDAARSDRQVALLLIDLDGFKQVNDTLGHDAGDTLLTHVGRVLREGVRDSDTVARYAGDEFVVILKGAHDQEDVGSLAKKLIDTLMQPQTIKGSEVRVGASIGIALYPAHATHSEDLIAKADEAMYEAKHQGKNRHCFFGEACA